VILHAGEEEILKPIMHFSCFNLTHDMQDKWWFRCLFVISKPCNFCHNCIFCICCQVWAGKVYL